MGITQRMIKDVELAKKKYIQDLEVMQTYLQKVKADLKNVSLEAQSQEQKVIELQNQKAALQAKIQAAEKAT